MRIIKYGDQIEETEIVCNYCKSKLAYTKYDINTKWDNCERIGLESSRRARYKYIECPVCKHRKIVENLIQEY